MERHGATFFFLVSGWRVFDYARHDTAAFIDHESADTLPH